MNVRRSILVALALALLIVAAACGAASATPDPVSGSPSGSAVSPAPAAPRPADAESGAAPGTDDAASRATATPFRIAVFGDVNSGTSATPPAVFASVCRAMRSRGASVAWSTGDAVVDLGDADEATARARWNGYLAVEGPELSAFMPVWRTAGDNDRLDRTIGLALWNELFPQLPDGPRRAAALVLAHEQGHPHHLPQQRLR